MSTPYVGRFAPSPTGVLHAGSLIAALGSFADARHHGGRWLLRIEDIDQQRCQKEAEPKIRQALRQHGLHWDGEVVRQQDRHAIYQQALSALHERGHLYACRCTRKVLQQTAKRGIDGFIYPGHCRDLALSEAQAALRLRVSNQRIEVEDALFGHQAHAIAENFGDLLLKRRDGFFSYLLAVVVDDAEQGISHVVRGADLLDSTTRQRYLQRQLGYPEPTYLHLPVAVDSTGTKLSKQHGAEGLAGEQALSNLKRAWAFLGQRCPPTDVTSVAHFIDFACQAWRRERIPPQRTRHWPVPTSPNP